MEYDVFRRCLCHECLSLIDVKHYYRRIRAVQRLDFRCNVIKGSLKRFSGTETEVNLYGLFRGCGKMLHYPE